MSGDPRSNEGMRLEVIPGRKAFSAAALDVCPHLEFV
jgi:hypothetical protein